MKRFFACAVLFSLIVGLLGCAKQDTEDTPLLQVGYGIEVVTPKESMPLGGYGNTSNRMSENVLDDLKVTCIALTYDRGEPLLLLSMDVINSSATKDIRKLIRMSTGVAENRIMVAATHTHSAPDQGNSKAKDFVAQLKNGAVAAAEAALADSAPTEIYIGSARTKGLNFVRHYLLSDGSYGGDNFGDFTNNRPVEHAEENDPQLQLIEFRRPAEDKQDILLMNWQAHPCITGGMEKLDMSADFIGSTRNLVEAETDLLFMYFTGAAGNQNTKSRLPGETLATEYYAFAEMLMESIRKARQNMTPAESGEIRLDCRMYTGTVDRTGQELLPQATEVVALWRESGREAGNNLAKKYGISSVYHANAIVNRVNMADTRQLEINAITIGDISFVTAPYEMFAAHGMAIKEGSPAKMTFVLSCCNGGNSYIPTNKAYDYGCYESYVGYFARGTGDELVENFLSMLQTQHS